MRPSILFLLTLLLLPTLAGALYSFTARHLIENIESHQSVFIDTLGKYLQQPLHITGLRGKGQIRHPRLTAHKLRIGGDQAFFTADELSIKLSLWRSLLHLAPRLKRLSAQNCRLFLRTPYMTAPQNAAELLRDVLAQVPDQIDALQLRNCRLSLQIPGKGVREYLVSLARIRRHKGHHDLMLDAVTDAQPVQMLGWLEYRHGALRKASVYAQIPLSATLQTLEDTGIILNTGGLQLEDAHGRFWWRYQKGAPQAVQALLIAARTQFAGAPDRAVVRNLKTELHAEMRSRKEWRAFSPQTQFLLAGRNISFTGNAERKEKQLHVNIAETSLQNALDMAQIFTDLEPGMRQALRGLQPTADLYAVQIRIPLNAPRTLWQLRAQVEKLHLSPWEGLPGVSTLDGDLQMQRRGGEFVFQGENFDFHLPPLYPPRRYPKASGALVWEQQNGQWLIDSRGLKVLTSNDNFIEAQIALTLPPAGSDASAEIDCLLYASELDFASALAHIPEETLRSLPEWLYRQDHGGSITEAQVRIQGPLSENLREQLRVDMQTEFEGLSLQTPLDLQLLQVEGAAQLTQNVFRANLIFTDSLLGGQPWYEGAAEVLANDQNFEIRLTGDGAAGWIGGDGQQIAANLEYLHLPEMQVAALTGAESAWTATVTARIDELSMDAQPLGSDLRFSLLNATDRVGVHSLNGEYRGIGIIDGVAYKETSRDVSSFEGVLSFCNWEELLAAYSCPPEREQRNNRLAVNLSWPGDFSEFTLEKSVGELRANLNEGHFLKLGNFPGQKFLQLLNLDALLRRLQPSISALSADGMNYEKIRGGIRVQDGVIRIEEEGLVVESANGKFRLAGTLDMLQRQLDGELNITLPISQNLPWYSLLLGGTPAGAAALWLTSRIFDNPLGKMFTVNYKVKGSPEDIRFQVRE